MEVRVLPEKRHFSVSVITGSRYVTFEERKLHLSPRFADVDQKSIVLLWWVRELLKMEPLGAFEMPRS
ncbi:hypothetical protein L1887_18400 [Cichorium endivia]|nr:hypothetical protein L1887_18400 [Cichorium endivia]